MAGQLPPDRADAEMVCITRSNEEYFCIERAESMKKRSLKTYSLEEITDKFIGKRGTPKREAYEEKLRLDLLSQAIKQAKVKRK